MRTLEQVVAKVLDLKPGEVTDKTGPENTESWDSFNGLVLATELENNFKVKFSIDEVVSVKNVGDIKRILKKHGFKI